MFLRLKFGVTWLVKWVAIGCSQPLVCLEGFQALTDLCQNKCLQRIESEGFVVLGMPIDSFLLFFFNHLCSCVLFSAFEQHNYAQGNTFAPIGRFLIAL